MNLALVISSLSSGGAERVMSELASYWGARGDRVTLITVDGCASDAYALHPNVRRVALDMMRDSGGPLAALAANLRRMAAVRRSVRESEAEVVLSFEDRTNAMVLLATAFMPQRRVISQRIDPARHTIGLAWRLLRRVTYPLADVLVVQTAALLPWAGKLMFARARAAVIPNPVRDMSAHAGRAGHVAPEQRILAVGRLTPQKGFDVLLRAFARVAREHPRCSLTIAGEGPDLVALRAQAGGLGIAERVEFPGWIAEPGVLLERTALFVMSSRYEGFPNALLEAMACGVPVISTRWRGAEEMVTDGVDGLLVAIDSESELAGAIERVLTDGETRERLGRAGRAVAERYRLAAIIEQWDAVLVGPARVMGSACSQKFYS